MKTAQEFEIVGYAGSMIAVGVTGSLTSRTVDVAIIDDPVKDELEASSPTYRERVFQWYSNVLETRLHNDSKVILIMTRWHEDDLAGRLLEREPEEWDVVHIRAIKTDRCPKEDPRQVGEALWPERHSLERLMKIKELSPSTFDGLYQGDPGDPEGGNIKRSWFVYLDELPKERINWQVYIDGAYTENTKNDPTGILIVGKWQNKVIVRYAESAYLEMPGLIKHIPLLIDRLDLGKPSMRIEPKASGLSLMQMLRSETPYPATAIKGPLVREGKAGREAVASKWIEGEKVLLLRGRWNEEVVHQLTKFGKTAHDEYVDLVGYATNDLLGLATQSAGVRRRN